MKVSVLICTFNKCKYLNAVLKNLSHISNSSHIHEVLVVVDGSNDGTLQLVKDFSSKFSFSYHFVEKIGLAKARNYGIERCTGDYILFCDDDTLLRCDYLTHLYQSISQHPNSIHIGNLINIDSIHSMSIIDKIDNDVFEYENFFDYQNEIPFFNALKFLYANRSNYENFRTATWWALVSGGNLCIPKVILEEVGKFDPLITGWGPEDADLCYRIFLQKHQAVYNENCLIYHLDHQRNLTKNSESMIRNATYFYKKHNKPKELFYYLRFMNGLMSLKDFNSACSNIFGINEVEIPRFFMSMDKYSYGKQLIKYDKG